MVIERRSRDQSGSKLIFTDWPTRILRKVSGTSESSTMME